MMKHQSVKTIRQYKFGMVFGDKYGRETPVISSANARQNEIGEWVITDGGITLEKQWSKFQNRFKLQQNWINGDEDEGEIENWMEYVKYYVKDCFKPTG